jgi:hypothetical protein
VPQFLTQPTTVQCDIEAQGTIVMADEDKTQSNRVDRSFNGAFSAFWHGRIAYENGRVKRFETEGEAWEFLARCDAAGKIIR